MVGDTRDLLRALAWVTLDRPSAKTMDRKLLFFLHSDGVTIQKEENLALPSLHLRAGK